MPARCGIHRGHRGTRAWALSSPKSSTSDIASGNLAYLELSEVPVARSKSKQKIKNRKNKQRTRRRKKALALAKKEAAK